MVLSACVILVSLFAIYVNGTDYFVTGFIVIIGGLVSYVLCKWVYKGRVLDEPELYPLNPKTKIRFRRFDEYRSLYDTFWCIVCWSSFILLDFYEGEYGTEYYLERISKWTFQ